LAIVPEDHVHELDVDAKQSVVSALRTRLGATRLASPEERVEDVAHVAEAGHATEVSLTAHVIVATLFGVPQDVIRVGYRFEPFLGVVR
jgi:phosphoribosylcarboxyaminoimidazole (NCAIR) mutase